MDKTKEYYLTEQGLEELKKELEELKMVRRPAVIEALKEARSLGDLSENAEYDAARSEQAEVEGRIAQLEVMIEKAVIIEKNDSNVVSFGYIDTGMTNEVGDKVLEDALKKIPMKKLGDPDDAAKIVVDICSDHMGYMSGQVIRNNGLLYL